MQSVLLVNAPVGETSAGSHAALHPPLGLGYIGAVLRERGHTVSARDLNVTGMSGAVVERAVKRSDADVLGISAHTETYPNALEIARTATDVNPDLTVLLGGPHASVNDAEAATVEAIDYVVRGEGELTTAELVKTITERSDPEAVDGITFERDGQLIQTPDRPYIQDPTELPFPARDLFPLELYQHPGNMLFSRGGCPFQCHFCAVNNIWGDGMRRYRAVEDVLEEVKLLVDKYGFKQINFADDTFTLRRDRTEALLAELRDLDTRHSWNFTCSTRVDLVDGDLLETLAKAGCSGIQFGVEAGSQKILDSIGKKISLTEARDAIEAAVDLDMDVLASFMFPHPDDTETTIRQQAAFMRDIKDTGAAISLAFTTPYPGTVYDEYVKNGDIEVRADSYDEYDAKHLIIDTKNLSFQEVERLRDEVIEKSGLKKRTSTTTATGP
ncbi:MAG: radical SAM protein [Halodesulfurarchaeum sp.]